MVCFTPTPEPHLFYPLPSQLSVCCITLSFIFILALHSSLPYLSYYIRCGVVAKVVDHFHKLFRCGAPAGISGNTCCNQLSSARLPEGFIKDIRLPRVLCLSRCCRKHDSGFEIHRKDGGVGQALVGHHPQGPDVLGWVCWNLLPRRVGRQHFWGSVGESQGRRDTFSCT
jgi:hypothetical protein